MYNILLIGDSLTYLGSEKEKGWVNYLKGWYKNKVNIINKGINHHTSKMIINKLDQITNINIYNNNFNNNIELYTILLGTNDCYNPYFHVNANQYKENILYIINNLKNKNPNSIILLITPPICKINGVILEYVNEIYKIVNNLQKNQLVTLVDLYHGTNNIDYSDLENDGMHLNSSGNWKIYCKIKETIEKQYSFFAPNNL